jgi:phage FluMu protein Com
MKRIIAENLKCPQCSYITELKVATVFSKWAHKSNMNKSQITERFREMFMDE